MTVTISKWGNSQGFRVPKDIFEGTDEIIQTKDTNY